jgi:WD40 repeat protein
MWSLPLPPDMSGPNLPRDRAIRQVFGSPRWQLTGPLLALTYLPDGTLASVAEPGVLCLWELDGYLRARYFLNDLELCYSFAPHGEYLAAGGAEVLVWHTPSGSACGRVTPDDWTHAVALDQHGQYLATGHDTCARVWEVNRSQCSGQFPTSAPVAALALSSHGEWLAIASEDGQVQVRDLISHARIGGLSTRPDRVAALAWHPSQPLLAVAAWDGRVRWWLPEGRLFTVPDCDGQTLALAFAPDGRRIVTAGSDRRVRVHELQLPATTVRTFGPFAADITALAASPDLRTLAFGGEQAYLHVYDLDGVAITGGHDRPAHLGTLTRGDDRLLVSNAHGQTLAIWNQAGQPVALPPLTETDVRCFASNGSLLLTADESELIRLWSAAGQLVQTFDDWDGPVATLALTPDGTYCAAARADDGSVTVWNSRSGAVVWHIPAAAEADGVVALAFGPAGRTLAVGGYDPLRTAGRDGCLCVWDTQSRTLLIVFDGSARQLAFDRTGRRLVATSVGEWVRVYELGIGLDTGEVRVLAGHRPQVAALALHPSQPWLAVADSQATLRIWDIDHGQRLGLRELAATALHFCPTGQWLYASLVDGTCVKLEWSQLLEAGD